MLAPITAADDVDFLSLLSVVNRRRFLERSTIGVYPAGALVFHPDSPLKAFLIERGLIRGYTTVPDGRQATVGFRHSGELVGVTMVVSHQPRLLAQVVVESTLRTLDMENVRNLVSTEIEVVSAVATQLAARLRLATRLIAIRTLGNIRERLAYDVLERATRSQLVVGRLDVSATHAELADSIGSSREVVGRALSSLRAEGIVETTPGLIRVIDPMRLAGIVRAFEL
ncbi:MAG TPA: Crp/Fnr family transcriptional regulator [Candidatus Dormibacteraeota bacterium]|nr:Crp/Fnr family transcriptional regulator [Candidatus Dormibacteraeota bacterium]